MNSDFLFHLEISVSTREKKNKILGLRVKDHFGKLQKQSYPHLKSNQLFTLRRIFTVGGKKKKHTSQFILSKNTSEDEHFVAFRSPNTSD